MFRVMFRVRVMFDRHLFGFWLGLGLKRGRQVLASPFFGQFWSFLVNFGTIEGVFTVIEL